LHVEPKRSWPGCWACIAARWGAIYSAIAKAEFGTLRPEVAGVVCFDEDDAAMFESHGDTVFSARTLMLEFPAAVRKIRPIAESHQRRRAMRHRCLNWNGAAFAAATLLMLAMGACTPRADPPPPKIDPPPAKTEPAKPLPEEIVKAWKGAGAEVGWLPIRTGSWAAHQLAWSQGTLEFVPEKQGQAGDLPAFSFQAGRWVDGRVGKLPAPVQAFGLNLFQSNVTDSGLKELAGLKSMQALNLHDARVTDAGVKELAGLENLQSLNLGFTKITDSGLKELAAMKSLQALVLVSTKVTDAGLKDLAGQTSLQTLNLSDTKVTDAGLKELAGLTSLQTLHLGCEGVTDAGLKEVAGLKGLQWLDLSHAQVTDAGLKELAGLKSLQRLTLRSTKVTDAGLKELVGLKSLRLLDLQNSKVTDAGLKELRKALSGCTVAN
jgi:internalin A